MKPISTLALWLALVSPAVAQSDFDVTSPIPNGKCMLVIASRPSLAEAKAYIDNLGTIPKYTQVFPSDNGWFAITVGSLSADEQDSILTRWKASGRVPQDSFCSYGSSFGTPVNWQVAQATTPNPDSTGNARLTPDGYLEIRNADGSAFLRRLSDGVRFTRAPDGTIYGIQAVTNVNYASLPSLGTEYKPWLNDLQGRVGDLAVDILPADNVPMFADVGSDLSFYEQLLLKLRVLEVMAEQQ